MARGDRAGGGGRPRHGGDHAAHGQVEALRLALGGALCRRRRRGAAAGQDAAFSQKASRSGGEAEGVDENGKRNAHQWDALERAHHGQGDRHQPHERAAHLGRGGLKAAFDAQIQAVQRSEVRRKGHGRRRPLHEPAGQGAGALRRREKPVSRRSTARNRACL